MKKKMINGGLFGLVLWGVSACSSGPPALGESVWPVQDLLGSQWIDAGPTVGQVPVSLDIAKDAQMSGNAGCNRYMGKAEISGTSLRLVHSGSTRMFCFPEAVMETEKRFGQALAQTRSAKKEQGQLLLLDESGRVLWRFNSRS
jgi:heat shock protein HslJ